MRCDSELETVGCREWVHPVTAYRWFREGKLPVPATRVGGLILIDQPANTVPAGVSVVYAACHPAISAKTLNGRWHE